MQVILNLPSSFPFFFFFVNLKYVKLVYFKTVKVFSLYKKPTFCLILFWLR